MSYVVYVDGKKVDEYSRRENAEAHAEMARKQGHKPDQSNICRWARSADRERSVGCGMGKTEWVERLN